MKPCVPCRQVSAETLYYDCLCLVDDLHTGDQHKYDQDYDDNEKNTSDTD